jgi:hypothetical protein
MILQTYRAGENAEGKSAGGVRMRVRAAISATGHEQVQEFDMLEDRRLREIPAKDLVTRTSRMIPKSFRDPVG